ncbi:MAG: alpha-L-fucosidase [Thermoguttaceae bacterium]
MNRLASFLLALVLLVPASSLTAGEPSGSVPGETAAQRDARMAWWRQARFGMFIHWGVYSVPAGTFHDKQIGGIGEWIMRNAQIPVAEYRGYARDFNPVKFDPDAWAALADEAGMRYMVITSKHHDGFALFPSEVTDWDIADSSPYGKDLIGPLSEAARRRGLKFGLYYSQAQDWTHPGGAKAGMEDGQGWDPAHKGSFDQYLEKIAVPQVREILTRYRPDILWWDTPMLMTTGRADLLRPLLELRPGLITNNRLGGGYAGDTDTPEQHIPATGIKGRDWETCMTLNDTWGYKSFDTNWKSTRTLVRNLVDIASKGGNYLLNIGPKPDGTIPQESIDRLKEVGGWMKANGESIYGTTACPTRLPAWGRITTKAGDDVSTLYLHVFDWPADGKLPVPLDNQPVACRLLADATRTFQVDPPDGNGLVVKLTGGPVGELATVLVLQVKGQPQAIAYRVAQADNGQVVLNASDAELTGSLQVESKYGDPNIGFWTDSADSAHWNFTVTRPGAFELAAELATTAPSRFTVAVADAQLACDVADTEGYDRFRTEALGTVELKQPGSYTLTVKPRRDGWSPVNLRRLTLEPTK